MLKLTIIGNLGKDATINQTNGQTAINFSVVHNEKYTDKNGTKVEETTWVACTLWRGADKSTNVANFLKTGVKVYLEGKPHTKVYTDKNGQQIANICLTVNQFQILTFIEPKAQQQPATLPTNDLPA